MTVCASAGRQVNKFYFRGCEKIGYGSEHIQFTAALRGNTVEYRTVIFVNILQSVSNLVLFTEPNSDRDQQGADGAPTNPAERQYRTTR